MTMIPAARPQQSKEKTVRLALEAAKKYGKTLDLDLPFVVGQRGYFQNSMGVWGKQDRGIYDDALFIVAPNYYKAFNGNTDPSNYRNGVGYGSNKGMASLKPGIWVLKRGLHRGQYMALVQRVEPVTVIRDAEGPDYEHTGWHGINIHRGGRTTTSSLGCQTIPVQQWDEFYSAVDTLMDSYNMEEIKYVLIERQG